MNLILKANSDIKVKLCQYLLYPIRYSYLTSAIYLSFCCKMRLSSNTITKIRYKCCHEMKMKISWHFNRVKLAITSNLFVVLQQ